MYMCKHISYMYVCCDLQNINIIILMASILKGRHAAGINIEQEITEAQNPTNYFGFNSQVFQFNEK